MNNARLKQIVSEEMQLARLTESASDESLVSVPIKLTAHVPIKVELNGDRVSSATQLNFQQIVRLFSTGDAKITSVTWPELKDIESEISWQRKQREERELNDTIARDRSDTDNAKFKKILASDLNAGDLFKTSRQLVRSRNLPDDIFRVRSVDKSSAGEIRLQTVSGAALRLNPSDEVNVVKMTSAERARDAEARNNAAELKRREREDRLRWR